MRYLIYTETFPSRIVNDVRQTGIGRYCSDLASGLASLGHEVTVATNNGIGERPVRERFPVRVLGPPPRGRLERYRRAAQLRRLTLTEQPDVMLVGDLMAHRVVASLAGAVAAPYYPIFYGTELAGWIVARGHTLGRLRQVWLSWYLARAAGTICISRFTQSLLRQIAPGESQEYIVHPCVNELFLTQPVNHEFTAALRGRLASREAPSQVLLTVARISERKNQLGVLQAMDRARAVSDYRWQYVIVGNLDSELHRPYLDELRAYAAANGLADQLTVVEGTTDEEKIDYIDACDVFVMLSRSVGPSVEGFGISVIEAASRGKPVVVSDEGGMPETLVDGVTGYAVPAEDGLRISNVLAELADNPARRAAMGSAGREFSLQNFTPAASASRLHAQLLERAITAGRPLSADLGTPVIGDSRVKDVRP